MMVNNEQHYPNGIYAKSYAFPGSASNIPITEVGILTPELWGDYDSNPMPILAANQTINGVSGYNIFRLYRDSGWGWVNPDASTPDMWIGNVTHAWTSYTGAGKEYFANTFEWPTGHNSLRLNSMVSRKITNPNASQSYPYYIYLRETAATLSATLQYGLLHAVPAAASGVNEFFEEKSTWLMPTIGTSTAYQIVLAVKKGTDTGYAVYRSLELSFHFSL
jgi:hypothetical protein